MITRVNERLGFGGNVTNSQNISKLSFDDTLLIAKICAFQKGYNPERNSPFCVAFDEQDLKVNWLCLKLRAEGIRKMYKNIN